MAFRKRAADKAHQVASGGDGPPAGQDPQVPGEPATPALADRRRVRGLGRERDRLLLDLGALVMEMHRQGRHDPALVERKAREALALDAQVRALAAPAAGGTARGTPAQAFAAQGAAPVATPPPATAPPPSAGDRVTAAPPSEADRVADPAPATAPPSPADRVSAPPPSPGDLVSADSPPGSDGDDGIPTYTVTTR
jgi:hypothetical protein